MELLTARVQGTAVPLLPSPLGQFRAQLRKASVRLQLPPGLVTPHVIRHTGTSADRLKRRRSLEEVKKRDTLRSDKSVNYYERRALVLFTAQQLSVAQQKLCVQAHSRPCRTLVDILVLWSATRA